MGDRLNTISMRTLFKWSRQDTAALRVRSALDVLPGGWSAAMVPLLVRWNESHFRPGGREGFYIVRNVNTDGNPVEGITTLRAAEVPCDGVERAEFIVVPHDPLGKRGIAGHAMLRLVFRPDARPQLLAENGERAVGDASIDDLVFSWEAWRPPSAGFNAFKGLDPRTYGLTLRCFNGAQRFLEDALHGHKWLAYPLELPNPAAALNELLYIALAMGDNLARHTLGYLLAGGGDALDSSEWFSDNEYPGADASDRDRLRALLVEEHAPENPMADIFDGTISYQTVQYSCVTMALHMIDVVVSRVGDEKRRLSLSQSDNPPWMEQLAGADLRGVFARLPFVIWWLAHHQDVIPTRAFRILDDAGLLRREGGSVVESVYELNSSTPYGNIKDHLIL